MAYEKVEKQSDSSFVGSNLIGPKRGMPVYGGQLIAQAISAAEQTCSFSLKHLSIMFLNPANTTQILYKVDNIRDGRSISARRVTGYQDKIQIFVMDMLFKKESESKVDFQALISPLVLENGLDLKTWMLNVKNLYFKEDGADTSTLATNFLDSIDFVEKFLDIFAIKIYDHFKNKRTIQLVPKVVPTMSLLSFITDFFLVEVVFSTFVSEGIPLNIGFTTSAQQSISVHQNLSGKEYAFYYVVECERYSNNIAKANGYLFNENNVHIMSTSQEVIIKFV